jgi:MFS family permease
MFAPSIPQIIQEFHTSDGLLGSFMVSIYLLGYAFGPLFLAPCSELYGRLPVYHACTFFFMLGTLACGFSNSIGLLIFFRFVTGLFGAGPLTIGSGTVADCFNISGANLDGFIPGPSLRGLPVTSAWVEVELMVLDHFGMSSHLMTLQYSY